MDDIEDACRAARLHEQLTQAYRDTGVLLGRLEDEGVADRNGDAEHPHRDHRREVERGDARRDAQGLAHGIDVDARASALGVLTLQGVGDAAGELDDLQAALEVAAGVGDHLAVLGGQQRGEFVHPRLDQALELEHDPRAALGIGRGPGRLGRKGGLHRAIDIRPVGQPDARLHLAGIGVEHVAAPARCRRHCRTADEMLNVAHSVLHCPVS